MNEDEIINKLGIRNYDFRLIIGHTTIDYDRDKEEENRKKHGYSLESAVFLLKRVLLLNYSKPFITSDPFTENDEIRHMHMGVNDNGNVVFMVTAMRPNETIRVISFRRASEKERAIFSEQTGFDESIQRTRCVRRAADVRR